MRTLALICLVTLAACATPRQACERNALYDLRMIDLLIRETEQTIARGYALEREPYRRSSLELCYANRVGHDGGVGFVWCNRPEIGFRERPVAVDLRAERAALAELKSKRKDVARTAARALSACAARYPQP
ncbi:hypothetical protein [Rhodovulum euryhalinum]|uniref:Excinuclease ABC subunit B n=1 Tax=Rhodovulum euryhalinum TaxID=35805 RepID=A0A4R2KZ54_9RHOB|nr:hypothetical protein [Rhodovulum euryhalinum]TCO71985.1 hypothetical protein EV655_10591 [Rhodovulum euryhalinum]